MLFLCSSCTPLSLASGIIMGSGCIIGGSVSISAAECGGMDMEGIAILGIFGSYWGTLAGWCATASANQYKINKSH